MTQHTQSPIKEFRAASIKAAIWGEEREEEGRTVVRHTVRIQKRYLDKDSGEWRTTEYFFPNDLPRLCLVAEKAFEYIALSASSPRPTSPNRQTSPVPDPTAVAEAKTAS